MEKENGKQETAKKNEIIKNKDFVEIKYTGFSEGKIFDSNIEEDLKKIDPDGKVKEVVIVVGQGMVVPGLDKALEGKEVGKEYDVKISPKEAFGERNRELVKTIPLKAFTEKNVHPRAGMVLSLDNNLVKIIAVSGARVITDFNNPLAGKEIEYKFKIVRKVEDEKEKVETLFKNTIGFSPEVEVKDKLIVKGVKGLKVFVESLNNKVKDLIGKDMEFEEVKPVEKKKDSDNVSEKSKDFKGNESDASSS